jgi:RNA polymerase sigma-70 factor (ECF subfamily)
MRWRSEGQVGVLEELESLYRRRYAAFVRVATAVTGDEERARDAVHDGFVRAVRHRRRFRGQGSLESWVWRIVVNEARRRPPVPDARTVGLSAREAVGAENGAGDPVRALVAALPERQRLVLFLRYYGDLDYAAIADALGVAPGTVGATLHAAHDTLRRQLLEVE